MVGGGQPVRQTVLYACTVSDLRPALIVLTSDFQSWEGMQCGGVKTCSIKGQCISSAYKKSPLKSEASTASKGHLHTPHQSKP